MNWWVSLIHSLNKIISWHSLPSLTACIMKVCTSFFKVPAPLLHFADTREFNHAHYSLVDEFRLHCTPPHKETELQHALHIWQEILLLQACLFAHYVLRIDKCVVTRSTVIVDTLQKASHDFHCSFNFMTDRTLKEKNSIYTNERTNNGWNVWINYCPWHINPHTHRSTCLSLVAACLTSSLKLC